ncbi:ubiquinone biosynthesis hydrox [Laetiporus sulphureus 93-53]|uniref:Ubiquinone biosynthesis monooxygenase COQ6, mitochondrial n=1 Tax=Laetiporus sulphureus 93-53 TaxID=1314785 RepID=A0A165I187_9APHY|nr:ubiquinone biosynthesis hydrox [Laetiporus sulphureus 93-53]KZT12458.1 ubiquinone biosynthesis hydrox [Laetiporus sulphureus 93-53]
MLSSAAKSRACLLASRGRWAQTLRSLSTISSGPEECDIVIVGGGPAGLALASALGSSRQIHESLSIALVEAGDLSKIREWAPAPGGFSNRVSSITNASEAFLKGTTMLTTCGDADIGAWSYIDLERTMPIEELQVWDGISDARITFSASEIVYAGLDAPQEMARLIENLNLQRGLLRHLSSMPMIQLFDKVKVQSIQREEREGGGWPLVQLSDGRVLRARLLVGADGFNSPVRSYAGTQSYGWAYDTQAIVATLNHPMRTPLEPPNTVAYQRFLPTGPIAFLPLSPTASSLVWSTKPHLAKALMACDPAVLAIMVNAAFRLPDVSMRYLHKRILEAQEAGASITLKELAAEISWREQSHHIDPHSAYSVSTMAQMAGAGVPPEDSEVLPPFVTSIQSDTIASFPLRLTHADSYIGEGNGARTVLIGDAAHTIHPLAGQGLNMGLADVQALSHCINNAVTYGGDIGSYTALAPYARERYFENHKILSACDKLHKLYSATAEPIVWARSVGVEILNELDTVKAAMMISAGSAPRPDSPVIGWNLAANGIESIARGINTAKNVSNGLKGVAGAGVQGLFTMLANSGKASS